MQKKHYINIAFHNFKIKFTRNKTEPAFQNGYFNYKVQNCKCSKIKYLEH